MTGRLKSLEWKNNVLYLLDQRKLPQKQEYLACTDYKEAAQAIRTLAVRGAPAIGITAAYAMVLAVLAFTARGLSGESLRHAFYAAGEVLEQARPTAVNLSWAVREMEKTFDSAEDDKRCETLTRRAMAMEEEDKQLCHSMAVHGADLFSGKKNLTILTHCNTGTLATAGTGTALGVIRELFRRGQLSAVYADETRPVLQGARLTASELRKEGIPSILICDDMAALVMRTKKIDAIIVGADRIAANGDTANKIGTYGLAILAAYHHIPLYVAAPFSTFDFSIPSGEHIVIEERNPDEIRYVGNTQIAPADMPIFNPAFDITPHTLISGIITERGVISHPDKDSVANYERSISHG